MRYGSTETSWYQLSKLDIRLEHYKHPFTKAILKCSIDGLCNNVAQYGRWIDIDAWVDASNKWMQDYFGENVVHGVLHMDEAATHIHYL